MKINILKKANRRFIQCISFTLLCMVLTKSYAQTTVSQADIDTAKIDVSNLPGISDGEMVKKAVLELAVERAQNAFDVALDSEARNLVDDVSEALIRSASSFITPNSDAVNIAVLIPLKQKNNNPYLDKLNTWTNEALQRTENTDVIDASQFVRTTTTELALGYTGQAKMRDEVRLANSYFWLFAHEESLWKHNGELIKRTLRRIHAYFDVLELEIQDNTTGAFWKDQFVSEAVFSCVFEIKERYPNLLLTSQTERWDALMASLQANTDEGQDWTSDPTNTTPWNFNIETARRVAGLNIGLYNSNSVSERTSIIQNIQLHVDKVLAYQREDGAMPYHGNGNPSVNYHDELFGSVVRIYMQLKGEDANWDTRVEQALAKSAWKGPVMGKSDEFYTSPHYKSIRWNFAKNVEICPEAAVYLSGNKYARKMLNAKLEDQTYLLTDRNGKFRYEAIWFQEATSEELPENYTITDRNTNGPRAWYGNWNYAGAFAKNPNGMEGRETLIGCMTVDDDGRLNSILADVTPRILIAKPENPTEQWHSQYYKKDVTEFSPWAYLTDCNTTKSSSTISKNYSVSTSISKITSRKGEAYRGDVAHWYNRQIWVGLPGRIVGLVSVVPDPEKTPAETAAYAVNGVVRLISGGTAGAEFAKNMVQVADNHYRYGQLDIIVYGTTYDQTIIRNELTYRKDNYKASELTFYNDSDAGIAIEDTVFTDAKSEYPAGTDFNFLIEVRSNIEVTEELISVSMLEDGTDILGLEVITKDRALQTWLNTSLGPQDITFQRGRLPSGEESFAESELSSNEDGVFKEATFYEQVPCHPESLGAGQHRVLVVSKYEWDHENGWGSFEGYTENKPDTDSEDDNPTFSTLEPEWCSSSNAIENPSEVCALRDAYTSKQENDDCWNRNVITVKANTNPNDITSREGYLLFDLSIVDVEVLKNATLELHYKSGQSGDATIAVFGSNVTDWDEGIINFEDRPDSVYETEFSIANQTVGGINNTMYSWDITDYIKGLDETTNTITLVIKDTSYSGQSKTFSSREDPYISRRPKLVFEYDDIAAIDENALLDFSVFPIPVENILHIRAKTQITKIEIFNTLGALLLKKSTHTINVSNLASGIYYIKIEDTNGHKGIKKIIKKE